MKSRKKFTRVLATLLALVLLLGTLPMTALASESMVALASERLAETEVGLRESGGIAPATLSITGEIDSTLQREGTSFSDITAFITEMDLDRQQTNSINSALDANLIFETNYVAQTASMLSMAVGVVDMDDVPDSEVVEVMVWLQELPAVLDRIYQREGISNAALTAVAADAVAARRTIKNTMAQFVQWEYSELFAGFAITAPMSQVRLIANMPGVFAVTEMLYYELNTTELPILDPDYNTPGNLEMREYTRIGELHAMGITGKGVSVGIIDSGIDPLHPEFAHNYKGGWNFLAQAVTVRGGTHGIDGSHGTHVAGTVASGGIMSLGAAPDADLWCAQVFGATGPGGTAGSEAVVGAAMEAFAGARPATGLPKVDVVNMSLGIRSPDANSAFMSSNFMRNNLVLAGVTLVNSAGNSATERNATQRQQYTTTSSNASLSIAVASSQFGSIARWTYEDFGFSIGVSNADALDSSGIFRSNGFGNTEPITVTYNAGNTQGNPAWMDPPYYGTYERHPLLFVEGKGYEIVWVTPQLADTNEDQINAWIAATPADSMRGKILAFNRGFSFNTYYGEALRTGAAGVIMVDRDATSSVSMTIGNVPSAHGVIFQTGVAMRQVLLNALNASEDGRIFFNPVTNGRVSIHAPKEHTGHSSVGPVMENAQIKPDITAAGANIYSTALGGGYTAMGGTSMSSPFVAGTAALLIQHLRDTDQDASPAVVKARLMNTADPYLIGPNTSLNAGDPRFFYRPTGTESSVFDHGSGFVNIWRAINEDVWVTVSDTRVPTGHTNRELMTADMASFSFGEVDKGASRSLTATVNGLENYTVRVAYNRDTRYSNDNANNAVTVAVVQTGNTFTATVNVGEDANNDRLNGGNLYEGYIFVESGEKSYVLPWAVRVPHVDPPVIRPDPGSSDMVKITLRVDASNSIYNPTIGTSMWFDSSNELYDRFMSEDGVEFDWMHANCLRVPTGARMGAPGATNGHLLIGQTASITIEPDTYDILTPVYQNATLFIAAGEWRAVQEYDFKAGYEYKFALMGNPGGNPMIVLEEVLAFDMPAGTSPDAKVTIVAHNINFVTPIDVAAFLAAGGTMPPADVPWLQANAFSIPASAIQFMTGTFLPRGQSAFAVIDPGSYDFLPLWNQGTGLGVFGGEFGGANAHTLNFEAGWEYIFTADLVGGAMIFRLQKVPFDADPPNFDGVTRITLNVPTDRWGDGSGNQMWFDYDGDLFAAIAGMGNLPNARLAEFEAMADYSIPTNARLLPNGGAHGQGLIVRPFNSATITIPAGRYDYMTVNPDGAANWLVANANGLSRQQQFAFEANKHYTFTVVAVGSNDGVTLTVTDFIPEDVKIEVVAFDIAKPIGMVRNVVAPVIGEGFSGTVTWAPADARFAWDTAYTATVALTAAAGFVFADDVAVSVEGARNIALTNEGKNLSFAVDASTTARPDTARILAINESWLSHTMDFPEFNLLAFDATRTTTARLAAGGSVNLVNDFDHFVPEDFLEELMLFRWSAINENFPAGTYDWSWYTQSSIFGNFIDGSGTVTIEAGKTYIFYLDEDWDVSITECLHEDTKICDVRSIAATCEDGGLEVHVCDVCDYIVEEKVLDPNPCGNCLFCAVPFAGTSPSQLNAALAKGSVILATPGSGGYGIATGTTLVVPEGKTLFVESILNVRRGATLLIEGNVVVLPGGRLNSDGHQDASTATGTIIIAEGGTLVNNGYVEIAMNSTLTNNGKIINNGGTGNLGRFEVRAGVKFTHGVVGGTRALTMHRDVVLVPPVV